MNIAQAYKAYYTPKNLQEHMLRTGALATIIINHGIGDDIDKDTVIKTCLIHDIGKPIMFDLNKQSIFKMTNKEIQGLKKLQIHIKNNFATSEHQATIGIAKELNCSLTIIDHLKNLEWYYFEKLAKANQLSYLIPIYCDMRVAPLGIVSITDRITDLSRRRKNKNVLKYIPTGIKLETLIQKQTSIDLNSITESQLTDHFEKLLTYDL